MVLKLNKSMVFAVGTYISKFEGLSLKLEEAQETLLKSQAITLFLNRLVDSNSKAFKTMARAASHNLKNARANWRKKPSKFLNFMRIQRALAIVTTMYSKEKVTRKTRMISLKTMTSLYDYHPTSGRRWVGNRKKSGCMELCQECSKTQRTPRRWYNPT